jgi:hypothetical protein
VLPGTLTQTDRPYEASLSFDAAVRPPASIPHALARTTFPFLGMSHAVAFGSGLPPVGSPGDFHPQLCAHAWRNRSAYGLTPLPPFSSEETWEYDEKKTQRCRDFEGCRIPPEWGADLVRNALPV